MQNKQHHTHILFHSLTDYLSTHYWVRRLEKKQIREQAMYFFPSLETVHAKCTYSYEQQQNEHFYEIKHYAIYYYYLLITTKQPNIQTYKTR